MFIADARKARCPPLPPDPRRSPMATIYLAPSPEIAATRLPTRWSVTTLAVNQKALALLDKLKGKPEDNDTSKSLAGAAAKKRQELSKLSGAAFDKAYAQNEVAYHQTVNGALETTLIPSAKNGELKNLLETGLKLFQEHQKHAEHLVSELK